MNTIVLETKQVSDIKGDFVVPAYQRGYRWSKEVTMLLNDISEIKDGASYRYCLQPIVVKKIDDSKYELIDGQQRLTTIYLIYKTLNKYLPFVSNNFNLKFEIRTRSAEYLQNISEDSDESNIDFYYMKKAFLAIQEWFKKQKDGTLSALNIFKAFSEKVDVIWYEVDSQEDSNALFQRLNIGKIPLSSSELVKALFLCTSNTSSISKERQEEISLQWDNIEKELQDDNFWFFLSNKNMQPRINLILNLISGIDETNREKYATFFYFDNLSKTEDLVDIWSKIQHTFLILKDWYKNHTLYHKIGYLISDNIKLQTLYDLSLEKSKTEFVTALDELIKKSVTIDKNYGELSYDNATDYKNISRLLLLFNVESTLKNGEQSQWFPFDKFKKNNWSLEHIHAQQTAGMNTQDAWKEWLELHIPSIKNVVDDKDLIAEMTNLSRKDYKLNEGEFEDIRKRVEEKLSVDMNVEYIHSISNLALLSKEKNSALSNCTFDVKRNRIIQMDKEGQFIPYCTKMVFLKYYSDSHGNQLHFWGQLDRESYIKEMNAVLEKYLTEEIKLYKENA